VCFDDDAILPLIIGRLFKAEDPLKLAEWHHHQNTLKPALPVSRFFEYIHHLLRQSTALTISTYPTVSARPSLRFEKEYQGCSVARFALLKQKLFGSIKCRLSSPGQRVSQFLRLPEPLVDRFAATPERLPPLPLYCRAYGQFAL
jgi:hypothetical protein